ncbi:MAG: glycosyltransferase family 2 protein [Brumimicrobium sp.]|nr:glycosyltransferase family 2 protein [Brumimicrobium sp.]
MKPAVSILIPAKNESLFIVDCLKSIQSQTFKDWEAIIIDDHSEDNTYNLVRSFSEQDSRVSIYKNESKGIIEALRLAFKRSNGALITRMDADDLMLPEKLQVLSSALYKSGKGHIAVGGVKYFSEGMLGPGYTRYANWLNRLTLLGENFRDLYKECVIPSPSWMLFREDFLASGAFESAIYPEDYDLCFRFYRNGLKVIPNNHVVHLWRDYPERTSRNSKVYEDNTFSALKLFYFLKLHYRQDSELVLWGTGARGKKLAAELLAEGIPFHWMCNNPKKIGKHIYDQYIQPYENSFKLGDKQIVLTSGNLSFKKKVRHKLMEEGLTEFEDYFFFA